MASNSTPPDGIQQEATNQRTKASRQRFKPQLSCSLCRNRKLKCDRQLPCGNCSRRGFSASCTFVHGNQREKSGSISKGESAKGDVHSQIQNLEELVLSIMNRANEASPQHLNSNNSIGAPSSIQDEYIPHSTNTTSDLMQKDDESSPPTSFGRMAVGSKQASYVGDSHWTAILENIAGLKDTLEAELIQPEPIPLTDNRGPDLLLGGSFPQASKAEILSSLPPQRVVEAYVREFLDTVDMGADYIHRPTFENEINKFFADPTNTPISWIGLLYIVICLSVHYALLSKINSIQPTEEHSLLDQAETVELYRMRAVQCLLLSNYTEPDHHTIPTLLLYYLEEHYRTPDAKFGTWMVFGMIVRAAMRLGYHREASSNPNISIYRGEMQRRHWSAIVFLDMQNSLQVGLPRMIREDIFDTNPPHNILDIDFHENSTSLPPIRPSTEIIPINFSNCKHKLMTVSGRIMDQANSTQNLSYNEVTILDQALSLEESRLPPLLRTRSLSDLCTGTPESIFRRWQIDLIVQKSRIILHRRFLFPSKSSGTYMHPYSVKKCVDASMAIIQTQLYMFEQTQPGKKFFGNRWRASSLMVHDFLLAAMILCLHVGNYSSSQKQVLEIDWTREDMLGVLNRLHEIYDEKKTLSKEAAKAARTLKTMLDRLKKANLQPQPFPSSTLQVQGGLTPYLERSSGSAYPNPPPFQPVNPISSWGTVAFPSSTSFSSHTSSAAPLISTEQSPIMDHSPSQNINITEPPTGGIDQYGFNWDLWDSHFLPNPHLASTPPEMWDFDFSLSFDQNMGEPQQTSDLGVGGDGMGFSEGGVGMGWQ